MCISKIFGLLISFNSKETLIMNNKYKYVCEQYPELSRVIRNAFMSSVTNSAHKEMDRKEVLNALKKFKKKKRLKVIELFMGINAETTEFVDIIPNVVKFFDKVDKIEK